MTFDLYKRKALVESGNRFGSTKMSSLLVLLLSLCANGIGYNPYLDILSRPIPKFAEKLEGQDLADYINLVQPFFTAEPSKLTEEEQRALVMDIKFLPPEPNERAEEINVDVEIPESFDARKAWPQCRSIRIARDQSACNSCWAISGASTMSDRLCIQSNGTIQTLLSDADLTFCCRACGGCHGGHNEKAWQFVKKEGLCSGGLYGTKPYPVRGGVKWDKTCKKECQSGYNKTYAEDKIYVKEYHWLPKKVTEIQKEIMLHGPVHAGLIVFSDFLQHKKGVYARTGGKMIGGHAVKIIGWGVENNTVPYWLIANSWGPNYGEQGHFKMIRGRNDCGIETWIIAGTLAI